MRLRNALRGADWLDPLAIARSASHLADADEALFVFAQRTWEKRARVSATTVSFKPPTLAELARRMAARAIAHFGGEPRGQDLVRLIDNLREGRGSNVAGVMASVDGDEWVFRREPPRRRG